jgi:chromosome segregation ATPase
MEAVLASSMEGAADKQRGLEQQLQDQRALLADALQQRKDAEEALQARAAQLAAAERQREGQLQAAQEHLDETAKRLGATHLAAERYKNDNTTLLSRCEAMQQELALRDQETDRKGQEVQRLRAAVGALEEGKALLEKELAEERMRAEQISMQREGEERERAHLREELGAAVGNSRELARARDEVQQQLMNAKDGNTNLQDRVSVLSAQLKSRMDDLEDLRAKAAHMVRS